MTDVQALIESLKVHVRRDSLANVNWLLMEQVLAEALAQAQRETWEAAAKLGEEQSPHHTECALKWARKCRQQMKAMS